MNLYSAKFPLIRSQEKGAHVLPGSSVCSPFPVTLTPLPSDPDASRLLSHRERLFAAAQTHEEAVMHSLPFGVFLHDFCFFHFLGWVLQRRLCLLLTAFEEEGVRETSSNG